MGLRLSHDFCFELVNFEMPFGFPKRDSESPFGYVILEYELVILIEETINLGQLIIRKRINILSNYYKLKSLGMII